MGSIQFAGFGESEAVPSEIVDNEFVLANLRSQGVDTRGKSGADTESLIGIRTRWWSKLSSTEHAVAASRSAIADVSERRADFDPASLQLVHSGGSSPDNLFPACACEIQGALGIPAGDCEARDISLACCSWLDALLLAASRLKAKSMRWGLVAVGESIGTRLNAPTSLSHCLWGDAGGAVVLEYVLDGDPSVGLIADKAISDGQFAHWTRSLKIGTHPHHEQYEQKDASMLEHGKDIHRYAIRTVSKVINDLLAEHGLEDEKPYLLPHNSNLGMVRQIGKRLGIAQERVLTRIVERGNTSSASIAISLAHYARQGQFKSGDLLILASFGGGMAIDIALYRWP